VSAVASGRDVHDVVPDRERPCRWNDEVADARQEEVLDQAEMPSK